MRNNGFPLLCMLLPALLLFPLIWIGQDAYFPTHDFLDSDIPWYSVLMRSGEVWSISNQAVIEQYMNGLPRNSMPPTFHVVTWMFATMSPFTVCVAHLCSTLIVAFAGMYLLLRDFILRENGLNNIRWGIATLFAMLPFYGLQTGLASSGLPLVGWCLINLLTGRQRTFHYLILAGFSLYSSLLYSGLFLLIPAALVLVVEVIRRKRIPWPYFLGLAVLSTGYLISEINLINQLLFSDFQSHRSEFHFEGYGLGAALYRSADILVNGHYHTPSLHFPVIAGLTIIAACVMMIRWKYVRLHHARLLGMTVLVAVGLLFIALLFGFWGHHAVVALRDKSSVLQMLQWNRFHWLMPSLWFILFGLAIAWLVLLFGKYRLLKPVLYLILVMQAAVVWTDNKPFRINAQRTVASMQSGGAPLKPGAMSFKRFFAEDLFSNVIQFIGDAPSEFRVISVGIPADIAAYNGFYTLDSYQRNYALGYKHQFGTLIRKELDKSPERADYFNHWGSRCYVFAAELAPSQAEKGKKKTRIESLEIDLDVFRQMGGRYILSGHEIGNFGGDEIPLRGVFRDDDSYWSVYLYEVM